eukprot:585445-Pleurochrysis_carterae.AAC.1
MMRSSALALRSSIGQSDRPYMGDRTLNRLDRRKRCRCDRRLPRAASEKDARPLRAKKVGFGQSLCQNCRTPPRGKADSQRGRKNLTEVSGKNDGQNGDGGGREKTERASVATVNARPVGKLMKNLQRYVH